MIASLFRPASLLLLVGALGLNPEIAPTPPGPTPDAAGVGTAPIPQDDDATVQALGVRLRCPVCQGMPIGESPAPMAQDMMRQVRALRANGQNEEQIVAYFTSRYGKWVLLDPPKEGFALIVWMLPPAALMIAVGAALGSASHRRAAAKAASARAAGGQSGPAPDAAQAARLAAVRRAVQQ